MEQPTTTYHYHVSFETTFNFTLNSLGRLKQSRVWTQVQYIRLFDYSRKRRWTRKHLDIRIGQKSTGMLHFRFKYLKNNHNRPTCTSTTHIYTWTNRKITDTTQIHSHMLLLLMFNHDAIHKRNRHMPPCHSPICMPTLSISHQVELHFRLHRSLWLIHPT